MAVYKFMPSKYVDAFMAGQIHLGTMSEYAIPDGLSDGRSDEMEGKTIWRPEPGEYVLSEHPEILALFGRKQDSKWPFPGQKVIIEEGAYVTHSYTEDPYLFCFLQSLDDDLVRRMREKFEADACVRIDNIKRFAAELTLLRELSGHSMLARSVMYVDHGPLKAPGVQSFFRKATNFSWQKESRIAWVPRKSGKRSALDVSQPTVAQFLERMF